MVWLQVRNDPVSVVTDFGSCHIGAVGISSAQGIVNCSELVGDKFEAITLENNLAYIDAEKCKMCRKCEEACPKGAIHAFNFPPRKPKAEESTIQSTQTPMQNAEPSKAE